MIKNNTNPTLSMLIQEHAGVDDFMAHLVIQVCLSFATVLIYASTRRLPDDIGLIITAAFHVIITLFFVFVFVHHLIVKCNDTRMKLARIGALKIQPNSDLLISVDNFVYTARVEDVMYLNGSIYIHVSNMMHDFLPTSWRNGFLRYDDVDNIVQVVNDFQTK